MHTACGRFFGVGTDARSCHSIFSFRPKVIFTFVRSLARMARAWMVRQGNASMPRSVNGLAHGLLHLATTELQSSLVAPFAYARDFARLYLTRLCQTPVDPQSGVIPPIAPPSPTDLAFQVLQAPPMQGGEYLSPEVLLSWWSALDTLVRTEIKHHPGGLQAYLSERNPQWRLVGRVTLHLAENKRDPEHPFAFLATYIPKLSAQGRVQHEPLGKALKEYAGAKNRPVLLSLLVPIQQATERSPLIKELVESGEIYHPLAWSPREAYRFLQDIPVFEESGLIVRVPDWWKSSRPPRPAVNVKIDARKGTHLDCGCPARLLCQRDARRRATDRE